MLQELQNDPSILVALSDEAILARVVQDQHSIIPPLPGPPVPLQFTKAVKSWFSALVEKHLKASYDELVPKLKTGNPPLVSDPYVNFC